MAFKFYEQIKTQELPSMETGNVKAFLKDFAVSEDSEKPIKKAIEDLCHLVEPIMASLGTTKYIAVIQEILERGTGALQQREIYNKFGSFEYMIKSMAEQFYQ